MARCAPLTPLASALAPVTTIPPPTPSRNSRSRIGAEARRAGQQEERDGDEGEAEHEADLVAFGIEQRADAERGDHEAERLRKGDGAVLRGREMKALREIGQDGAEHGGDHSVDKDGEDGGKDEHVTQVPFNNVGKDTAWGGRSVTNQKFAVNQAR